MAELGRRIADALEKLLESFSAAMTRRSMVEHDAVCDLDREGLGTTMEAAWRRFAEEWYWFLRTVAESLLNRG